MYAINQLKKNTRIWAFSDQALARIHIKYLGCIRARRCYKFWRVHFATMHSFVPNDSHAVFDAVNAYF